MILTSFAIFCVATLGCALAPTIEMFMACRLLQATVSAGMVMSLVPMLGLVIGGGIEEFFGWRANFVLLGFGLLTILLIRADSGEINRTRSASFTEQFRA